MNEAVPHLNKEHPSDDPAVCIGKSSETKGQKKHNHRSPSIPEFIIRKLPYSESDDV